MSFLNSIVMPDPGQDDDSDEDEDEDEEEGESVHDDDSVVE